MTYIPPLCSEREPGGNFTDCTWASGVMLGNSATFGDYPNTRAEYEALRAASGDVDGGSSIFDLQRGMDARWGWHGEVHSFWSAVAALRPGTSFVLQGRYSSLPIHFRRWDRMFKGGHATHVVHLDDGTYWWQDPLAVKGYPGEQMLFGTLKRFYEGLAGARAMSVVVGERALPDTGTDPVISPGDDSNFGIERWTLDGSTQVYCIGGVRNDDGSTDGAMRQCANGPIVAGSEPILTWVARSRLTNGVALPSMSAAVWQAITSGAMPAQDCADQVAAEHERTRRLDIDALEALP